MTKKGKVKSKGKSSQKGAYSKALKTLQRLKDQWRSAEIKKSSGFKVTDLPDGSYNGVVKSASLRTSARAKCPILEIVLETIDGDYAGQEALYSIVLPLTNPDVMEIRLSQLKTFMALWLEGDDLEQLGEIFFDELQLEKVGNDEVWVAEEFEKFLDRIVDSVVNFTVKRKTAIVTDPETKDKVEKTFINIFINDLISTGDDNDEEAEEDEDEDDIEVEEEEDTAEDDVDEDEDEDEEDE